MTSHWKKRFHEKEICLILHDEVIKWKHFSRYWPFVLGIHRSSVNSPHKGQWCGALLFSLICTWINSWVNNGEADDLRPHRAHHDVAVMKVSTVPADGQALLPVASTSASTVMRKIRSCMHLTHWGRDKMVIICQTTFSNGFSSMKMYEFRLKFHWSLF